MLKCDLSFVLQLLANGSLNENNGFYMKKKEQKTWGKKPRGRTHVILGCHSILVSADACLLLFLSSSSSLVSYLSVQEVYVCAWNVYVEPLLLHYIC